MELGEKIKAARLEAGMSQRQLCGEVITRNMLSQIEHGTARPSMDTLRYLAARLGKSVSYFLEETAVTSPNQAVMADARRAYQAGQFAEATEILAAYQAPDPVFSQEYGLLKALCLMALAAEATREGRLPYAQALLEQAKDAGSASAYFSPALERERLLLLAQAAPGDAGTVAAALPQDDRELLLRAQTEPDRAAVYLDAAQDRESPQWNLLRGIAHFRRKEFSQAVPFLLRAEEAYPRQVIPALEGCYREMGDFKSAYEYACKQR